MDVRVRSCAPSLAGPCRGGPVPTRRAGPGQPSLPGRALFACAPPLRFGACPPRRNIPSFPRPLGRRSADPSGWPFRLPRSLSPRRDGRGGPGWCGAPAGDVAGWAHASPHRCRPLHAHGHRPRRQHAVLRRRDGAAAPAGLRVRAAADGPQDGVHGRARAAAGRPGRAVHAIWPPGSTTSASGSTPWRSCRSGNGTSRSTASSTRRSPTAACRSTSTSATPTASRWRSRLPGRRTPRRWSCSGAPS